MGPFLFNIFINDIVEASSLVDLIMYADDTTLIINTRNLRQPLKTIENNINTEI